jgi:hypothetical protein
MADIVFQDGGPISSTQLQDLVTKLNQIDAKATSFPDQFGALANKAIAQKMVAGIYNVGAANLSTTYKEIAITFEPPLTSEPASVQITVETTSTDSEIISFIKGGTAKAGGCTVILTRAKSSLGKDISSPASVKLHYFAVAKSS